MLHARLIGVFALFVVLAGPGRAVLRAQAAPTRASSSPPVSAQAQAPAPAAQPEFLAGTQKIGRRQSATKKEGFYPNGLPIIDFDPDTGVGLGAVGNVFVDGARNDPFFDYEPYQHRIGAQVFFTTNGMQQHFIDYDAPYLAGTPVRLRAHLQYERNTSANYYGRGASTLAPLTFPGSSRSYGSSDAYSAALRRLQPGNIAYTLYNKYDLEDPSAKASLERVLFRGLLHVQAGLRFTYARVQDYSGASTVASDPARGGAEVHAIQATTRLKEDCQARRIVGCGGGFDNVLKLGVALDTRDYEPDPNSGVFIDVTGEFSSRVLGSSFDYARLTIAPRVFVSPFPKWADLVFAGRAVYSIQSRGTPFFAMNTLGFTDVDRQGLGGLWTLRGYHQDRFVGPVSALLNFEVRWTFVDFDLLSQHIGLAAVPFLDLGRVFDSVSDMSLTGWKNGGGGSLRIAWNDATIIDITAGASSEGLVIYMDLGNQF